MRMRASRFVLLALVASHCSCAGPLAARHVPQHLEDVVRANGYLPLRPARSDILPACLVEVGSHPEAPTVRAYPDNLWGGAVPSREPAAALFLTRWKHSDSVAAGIDVLRDLTGATKDLVSIKAGLESSQVVDFSIEIGRASIRALSTQDIRDRWDKIPGNLQVELRQGTPLVMEALVVEDVRIGFRDATGKSLSVGLTGVLGLDASYVSRTENDGEFEIRRPVTIGYKTQKYAGPDEVKVVDDDHEPNDSLAAASGLSVGHQVSGRVGEGNDAEDWYVFTPERDGQCSVRMVNTMPKNGRGHVSYEFVSAEGKRLEKPTESIGPSRDRDGSPVAVSAGRRYAVRVFSGKGHLPVMYSLTIVAR